ncbi:MAG TPA: hypothetical protein VF792_11565 [Ktedonobacterales bacterium]
MAWGQRRIWATPLFLVLMVALTGCDASFWASSPRPQPIGPGCPAWTASTRQITIAPPTSSDPLAIEAYNAQLVNQTVRPPRDLYSLTQQLANHKQGHISCQETKTPPEEQVGAERSFWVINPTSSGYHRVNARLDYVTPHVYDYVQDGATVDYLALKLAADRFEEQAYIVDRAAFGDQWSLGPNHQPRITLLNAVNLGPVGGYFSSEDEYPTSINLYSNARQMIYLNLSGGAHPGTAFYDATLAHEFQHMIHWWARPGDPSWVNEGMSVLAQRLNGYGANGVEHAYFNAPQTPLANGWSEDSRTNIAYYGVGYAFMDYFFEHYGGNAALRALMASSAQVPQAFDQALARLHSRDRFGDVYSKFLVANLLNDPTLAHGDYGYEAFPGEHVHLAASVNTYPYSAVETPTHGALPQYGAAYYDFHTPRGAGPKPATLNVTFSGLPTTSIIPNTPDGSAQTEWWSNSGDNMDSTLTRAVDLTNAAPGPIALTFNAWYALENGYDYTYIEASDDNGATWTALPVTTGSSDNPNGTNEGFGMTGVSGGGAKPQWTPETVDLTPYAGKKIRLRFETVTDDAVHYAGFALDNVSIAAINYSSDTAPDTDWSANGWINTTNVLQQQWNVQEVIYHADGRAPDLQRAKVDVATGQTSLAFLSFGGDISHVTLIISPVSPTIFTSATYSVSASVN